MQKQTVAEELALTLDAIANCKASGNAEWEAKHRRALARLVTRCTPSGAGFDRGTSLDSNSTSEKLVFHTAFHHMKDGFYAGWTTHKVTVTASLLHGIAVRVSGANRGDIKDYIHGVFSDVLSEEVRCEAKRRDGTTNGSA